MSYRDQSCKTHFSYAFLRIRRDLDRDKLIFCQSDYEGE
ncbi:hypothetical protein J2T46_003999 [Pseudomonas citronellolis]|nr:hypothetical protein [Pseudomonas citronellolis]MCP1656549.1 hypothetical protein [Pseudomonas citronellolis]MCP1723578.1 hypothetical protein [Pseudomonas citronellolis]